MRFSSISSPVGALVLNTPFTATNLTELTERFVGQVEYLDINALDAPGTLFLAWENTTSVAIVEATTTSKVNDVANHIKASSEITVSFDYIVE